MYKKAQILIGIVPYIPPAFPVEVETTACDKKRNIWLSV